MTWIRPTHLDQQTVLLYRQQFEKHPARMVVVNHFLQDSVADRLSNFLSGEAEFRPEYGLYSTGDAPANEQAWLNADEKDRFFKFSKLVGAPHQFRLSLNMLIYLQLRTAFQSPSCKAFFEQLSGMRLGSSDDFGAHAMKAGDFLKSHNDNNRNRSLALVIYLSPDWSPRFGGTLDIVDSQGRATRIEPEYNSMVVFDVAAGTTHLVNPISSDVGDRVRLTIGGWYHKPD